MTFAADPRPVPTRPGATSRPRRLRPTLLVLLLLGAAALVGCSGGDVGGTDDDADAAASDGPEDGGTGTATVIPDGVTLGLEFPRYLQVAGERMEVVVDNRDGTAPVRFSEIGLEADGFTASPTETVGSPVRAGRRTDLQIPFGDVDCAVEPAAATVVGRAVIDGAEVAVAYPVDPGPLRDIHRRRCAVAAVLDAFTIRFSDDWSRQGDEVVATLDVHSIAGADATIDGVRGSVIFNVEPVAGTDGPLGTVAADAPDLSVPVSMRAGRCDTHAVADSKKTYIFAVWVTTTDAEATFIEVRPDAGLEAALQVLIDECLLASTTGQG